MGRFAFGALRVFAGEPKIVRSSLLNRSICSLISAARLRWLTLKLCISMGQSKY
jgi:hypothetical protein